MTDKTRLHCVTLATFNTKRKMHDMNFFSHNLKLKILIELSLKFSSKILYKLPKTKENKGKLHS